jgi:hypothetical protein
MRKKMSCSVWFILLLFLIYDSEFQAPMKRQCTDVAQQSSTSDAPETRLRQFAYQYERGLTRSGNRSGEGSDNYALHLEPLFFSL